MQQESVPELTSLVSDVPFLHAEDCGKVLGFLELGRLGLEFVEPGIAHSRGCQEVGVGGGEGGQAGWTPAHGAGGLTSCIPGAAGGGKRQLRH